MSTRRALVVEDSSSMRHLVCFALQKVGLESDECENGAQALKKLEAGTYDVLLIDINMPVIDGLKVLERIKEDPRHRAMRICVLTTEKDDRLRAMALGAHEYLTKPVQSADVVPMVERLLSG